jgi:hypothetical protein
MYDGIFKVTYIDKEQDSLVKTVSFDTLFKAIGFTNNQPRTNQILELKFYSNDDNRKPNRS